MRVSPTALLRFEQAASPVLQGLVLIALLAFTPFFSQGEALKPLLLFVGLLALWVVQIQGFTFTTALVPFAFYWAYSFWNLTSLQPHHGEALSLFVILFAFLLGYGRPLKIIHQLVLLALMVVMLRGFWDMLAFAHLGSTDWTGSPASFFSSPHAYGAILVCAVYYHFYLIEGDHLHWAPVRFFIYLSLLLTFYSLFLVNARGAHLGLLVSLLPLIILSLNPHAKKPHAAKLLLAAGIAWCVGAFLSLLPSNSFDNVVKIFFPVAPEMGMPWENWRAAGQIFLAHPWFGSGTGSFAFAALEFRSALSNSLPNPFGPEANAFSHYLRILAEKGAVGLSLEIGLLIAALISLGHAYLKRESLPAKYAFYALIGLSAALMVGDAGSHIAPKLFYWLLIGYGWSLWEKKKETTIETRTGRFAALATLMALVAYGTYHSSQYVRELRADYFYHQAKTHFANNAREFTNRTIKAMAINPRHGQANYDYILILSGFGRFQEALQHLEFADRFAPNPPLSQFILAKIELELGDYTMSFERARKLTRRFPENLGNWETLLYASLGRGRCEELDSLQTELRLTLEPLHPPLPSRDYSAIYLDSLFENHPNLNFLQRRIGGESLRDRFFQRKREGFQALQAQRDKWQSLQKITCDRPKVGTGGSGQSAGNL